MPTMGCLWSRAALARHAAAVAALPDRQICARDFVYPGALEAYAVQVHDGDTLRVCFWHRGEIVQWRVRLAGIDAPELRGADGRGEEAREALRALVFRNAQDSPASPRRLALTVTGFDKYGRLLGRVSVGGKDVATELFARGLGREMDARGRRASSPAPPRSPIAAKPAQT